MMLNRVWMNGMITRTYVRNLVMPVKRIFLEDTFKFKHDATVTAVGKDEHGIWICLDETIFHPQGGGQPADKGHIAGLDVIGLYDEKETGEIKHYLAATEDVPEVGAHVSLAIDAEHRLSCAVHHTAGHLLARVVEMHYQVKASGGHSFPGESSCSFKPSVAEEEKSAGDKRQAPSKEAFQSVAKLVLAAMSAQLQLQQLMDERGVRQIKIGDYPADPCGGTHLKNTSQIGVFSVRSVSKKKGVWKIGFDASIAASVLDVTSERDTEVGAGAAAVFTPHAGK